MDTVYKCLNRDAVKNQPKTQRAVCPGGAHMLEVANLDEMMLFRDLVSEIEERAQLLELDRQH